jgi:hypothetical protein
VSWVVIAAIVYAFVAGLIAIQLDASKDDWTTQAFAAFFAATWPLSLVAASFAGLMRAATDALDQRLPSRIARRAHERLVGVRADGSAELAPRCNRPSCAHSLEAHLNPGFSVRSTVRSAVGGRMPNGVPTLIESFVARDGEPVGDACMVLGCNCILFRGH